MNDNGGVMLGKVISCERKEEAGAGGKKKCHVFLYLVLGSGVLVHQLSAIWFWRTLAEMVVTKM